MFGELEPKFGPLVPGEKYWKNIGKYMKNKGIIEQASLLTAAPVGGDLCGSCASAQMTTPRAVPESCKSIRQVKFTAQITSTHSHELVMTSVSSVFFTAHPICYNVTLPFRFARVHASLQVDGSDFGRELHLAYPRCWKEEVQIRI
jgi:hypothetical protein